VTAATETLAADHPVLRDSDLCHVARDGDWRSGGAETACGLFIDEPPCCESYDQQPPACGRPRCPECLMNVREEDGG
jgi:hypothetical protein